MYFNNEDEKIQYFEENFTTVEEILIKKFFSTSLLPVRKSIFAYVVQGKGTCNLFCMFKLSPLFYTKVAQRYTFSHWKQRLISCDVERSFFYVYKIFSR